MTDISNGLRPEVWKGAAWSAEDLRAVLRTIVSSPHAAVPVVDLVAMLGAGGAAKLASMNGRDCLCCARSTPWRATSTQQRSGPALTRTCTRCRRRRTCLLRASSLTCSAASRTAGCAAALFCRRALRACGQRAASPGGGTSDRDGRDAATDDARRTDAVSEHTQAVAHARTCRSSGRRACHVALLTPRCNACCFVAITAGSPRWRAPTFSREGGANCCSP